MEPDFPPEELGKMLLGMFPPKLRADALRDRSLRERLSLSLQANIRLDKPGVTFLRSSFFRAIREIFAKSESPIVVPDVNEERWQLRFNNAKQEIELIHEGMAYSLPDFACLDSNVERRLQWFDRETKKFDLSDARMIAWRKILEERWLDDEEVDELFDEYRLSPRYVAGAIENQLRRKSVGGIDTLVPHDIRYFERLVGDPVDCHDVKEFYDKIVKSKNEQRMSENFAEGLKAALLMCAHPFGAASIPSFEGKTEAAVAVFEWLLSEGDQVSKVGAIEWGLANLSVHPTLEPRLEALLDQIRSADAENEDRLKLFSALVVLTDGELAATGISRDRPPFWRRLASISHAAVIERAILAVGMIPEDFTDWAVKNRGLIYYLQTGADLRREPRWLPDFIFPEQLKPEFAGRIVGAADQARLESDVLQDVIFGDSETSVNSRVEFPKSFFPGPLEGGSPAILVMPENIEKSLIESLQKDQVTPRSFATLVNSALVFKLDPKWADLAAARLREAKYQLRDIASQDEAFALLIGLATVAAVTRCKSLAEETRVLIRVIRRKPGLEITVSSAVRICLIAAAANEDIEDWCKYLGDCLSEFAFEDMSAEKATVLHNHITMLRLLEPALWKTTSRADAAVTGLLAAATS